MHFLFLNSNKKNQFFEKLIGNNVDFTIDQQVLMTTILFTTIAGIFTFPIDILTKSPTIIMIANGASVIFFIIFYILIRFYKIYSITSTLYILVLFTVFTIDWFPNGGLQGGAAYFYMALLGYIIFLTKGVKQFVFLTIYIIDLTALFLIEFHFPEAVKNKLTREDKLIDSYFCFLLILFFIAFLIYILKKLYQQEKKNSIDIINQYRKNSKSLKDKYKEMVNTLSRREKQVFEKIIEGKTNKEIACLLFIDEGTVKNHITNIYKKLDVNKRVELVNKIKQAKS